MAKATNIISIYCDACWTDVVPPLLNVHHLLRQKCKATAGGYAAKKAPFFPSFGPKTLFSPMNVTVTVPPTRTKRATWSSNSCLNIKRDSRGSPFMGDKSQ